MIGILQMLASMFGEDTNAYDIAKKAADAGDDEAKYVVNTLDRAMEETGVVPSTTARSIVGNIILRLAFVCDDTGEDIDIDESPELETVIDTYDRFMDMLIQAEDEGLL